MVRGCVRTAHDRIEERAHHSLAKPTSAAHFGRRRCVFCCVWQELLLFFHHLPWSHRLRSNNLTILQHVDVASRAGIATAVGLRAVWDNLTGIDVELQRARLGPNLSLDLDCSWSGGRTLFGRDVSSTNSCAISWSPSSNPHCDNPRHGSARSTMPFSSFSGF